MAPGAAAVAPGATRLAWLDCWATGPAIATIALDGAAGAAIAAPAAGIATATITATSIPTGTPTRATGSWPARRYRRGVAAAAALAAVPAGVAAAAAVEPIAARSREQPPVTAVAAGTRVAAARIKAEAVAPEDSAARVCGCAVAKQLRVARS